MVDIPQAWLNIWLNYRANVPMYRANPPMENPDGPRVFLRASLGNAAVEGIHLAETDSGGRFRKGNIYGTVAFYISGSWI